MRFGVPVSIISDSGRGLREVGGLGVGGGGEVGGGGVGRGGYGGLFSHQCGMIVMFVYTNVDIRINCRHYSSSSAAWEF